ncbi:MAG: hypothetical protein ABI162_06660 [Luteolibacter sp.]
MDIQHASIDGGHHISVRHFMTDHRTGASRRSGADAAGKCNQRALGEPVLLGTDLDSSRWAVRDNRARAHIDVFPSETKRASNDEGIDVNILIKNDGFSGWNHHSRTYGRDRAIRPGGR